METKGPPHEGAVYEFYVISVFYANNCRSIISSTTLFLATVYTLIILPFCRWCVESIRSRILKYN